VLIRVQIYVHVGHDLRKQGPGPIYWRVVELAFAAFAMRRER
jgi:hypothetical protein